MASAIVWPWHSWDSGSCWTYLALLPLMAALGGGLYREGGREHFFTVVLYGGALLSLLALPLAADALGAQLLLEGYALCSYALLACGGRGSRLASTAFGEGDLALTLRYFSVSALASLLLLSGWALFLASHASLELSAPARLLATAAGPELFASPGAGAALACLLAGLALKLALAPLHLWAPAVYARLEGRLYVFFLALAKPLLLFFLGRLLVAGSLLEAPGARGLLEALALASLLVGSLGALGQRSLRTLFLYSSMANGGFMLLALALAPGVGELPEEFTQYLLIYGAANGALLWWLWQASALGSTFTLGRALGPRALGLRERLALTLVLLALAGFPPLGLFWPKLSLLQALALEGRWWLLAAVLLASIATFGYLFPLLSTLWAWALPRKLGGHRRYLPLLTAFAVLFGSLTLPLMWLF